MAIRLNDVVQFTVSGIAQGQSITNVLHYVPEATVDPIPTPIATWLATFRTAWRAAVLPSITSDYTVFEYRGVVIRGTRESPSRPGVKILDLGDTAKLIGDPVSDQGGEALAPLPTFTTASFQKVTGLAGPSNRGAMRIGPIPELFTDTSNSNVLTVAGTGALEPARVFLTDQLAGLAGENLRPVVFSRTELFRKVGPENNTTGTWNVIVAALLSTFVGTQTTRKEKQNRGH